MHTFEECKVKVKGIKILLSLMRGQSKGNEMEYLLDSTEVLCDELLREEDGEEKRSR